MLKTLENIKDSYRKYFPNFDVERLRTVVATGLDKKEMPEWFYGPDCAQLVADTYSIPVCIYPSAEQEHPGINPAITYLPLNVPKSKSKPVAIHIQNGHNVHWYAIRLGINQSNLPPVYNYYLRIEGKLKEYETYWNKWRQFPKQPKKLEAPTYIYLE